MRPSPLLRSVALATLALATIGCGSAAPNPDPSGNNPNNVTGYDNKPNVTFQIVAKDGVPMDLAQTKFVEISAQGWVDSYGIAIHELVPCDQVSLSHQMVECKILWDNHLPTDPTIIKVDIALAGSNAQGEYDWPYDPKMVDYTLSVAVAPGDGPFPECGLIGRPCCFDGNGSKVCSADAVCKTDDVRTGLCR